MSRRIVPLTGGDVERLPASCRGCLFWELGIACEQPRTGSPLGGIQLERRPSDPVERKAAWVSTRVQDGTPPGRVVEVDGEVVAYALFGPARDFAPRAALAPNRSTDALLLATMYVRPTQREHGLGRVLIHAAAKEAIRLGLTGVECYVDRRWRERACLLPSTWLLHEGFTVHREHPRTPLVRLDVRRLARWSAPLEHAVDEVLARLPKRTPSPVRVEESPDRGRTGGLAGIGR